MAYDMSRCPQTEAEMQDMVYTLFGRTLGAPANDWYTVMANTNIPHNVYKPGMQADATWPYYGLTQMAGAGGPRGRIFLPAAAPDDGNWYTRQIQVIADGPQTGTFVWAWQWISGNAYAPVQGATGGTQPPVVVVPGGGLTEAEVQAMIDDSIGQAMAAFVGVKFGDKIALRTNSGLLAGIKGGGPTVADAPIEWIGKTGDAHAWESLTLEPGE